MFTKLAIHFLFLCLLSTQAFAAPNQARVAVVGGGGAGLTTTWLLDEDYDVTLYESAERLGGHANTVEIVVDGKTISVEAGFEFISKKYYPTFYNLLKNIVKVPLKEYTMTSTFYHTDGSGTCVIPPIANGTIEWGTFTPHNLFKLVEMGILIDHAEDLISQKNLRLTLQQYADSLCLTEGFKEGFIYPFLAANWGVTTADIKKFAAYDALKYIVEGKNIKDYKWIEVTGGTQKYIQALAAQLKHALVKISANIVNIQYVDGQYLITEADGTTNHFDHLIIGTNAMQANQLLKDIPETSYVRSFLSAMKYFKTTIAIHGDKRFMPKDTDDWSIVNIRYDGKQSATTIHKPWLSPKSPVFKSWMTYDVRSPSDHGSPMPSPLYAIAHYDHVIGDLQYFKTQQAIRSVQGHHNLWFVGNYTYDEDSHESAILSAVYVAQYLAPDANRLQQLTAKK
jgi:predicted NAD/FAD-binding protein